MTSRTQVTPTEQTDETIRRDEFEALREAFLEATNAGMVTPTPQGLRTFIKIMVAPMKQKMELIREEIRREFDE